MNSSLCSFLQPPIISSLFDPKILSTLFSNNLSLCSSLNIKDQFLTIENHRQNYNVVYSDFNLSNIRREDKSFWTELLQALPEFCLLFISYCIRFVLVTVVSKYFNCATFSKHLLARLLTPLRRGLNRVGVSPSPHLRTETVPLSETLCFLVSRIPNGGQSSRAQ
jgi:hypothetical protein